MRSLKTVVGALAMSALILSAAACSDDDNGPQVDSKVTDKDGGPDPDGKVKPPDKLTCNNDCKDFVMSRLIFPDATTASKIGKDYNNDGNVDNALGQILAALGGVAPSMNLQESVDGAVYAGKTILLVRMQASDFQTAATAAAQAWVGESTTCCSDPTKIPACKTEAMTKCFDGSSTFTPDPSANTKDAIFGGSITGGKFEFGPSEMVISLPITTQGVLTANLKGVYISGELSSDGKTIKNGQLAGAVTKSDLDSSLIPAVKDMLNSTLNDPKTDKTTKDTITTLFDKDNDGTISLDEVKGNSLIKMFLAGDVDVTGDGNKEMTLGIGFEGVAAVINDKGTTVDSGTPDTGAVDAGTVDAPAGD